VAPGGSNRAAKDQTAESGNEVLPPGKRDKFGKRLADRNRRLDRRLVRMAPIDETGLASRCWNLLNGRRVTGDVIGSGRHQAATPVSHSRRACEASSHPWHSYRMISDRRNGG
jgi:hypothetical protein